MLSVLPSLQEIKKRRKALALTQPQLAREAGVSQSLIAKLEAGKIEPSYSRAQAIFTALERLEQHDIKKVKEVMVRHVVGIDEDKKVHDAIAMMKRRGISQLPVMKRGVVVGSISEKIILDKIMNGLQMEQLEKTPVHEIMEEPFPIVSEDLPVRSVLPLLQHNPAVLVSKRGELTGILTKSDLLGTR